LGVFWGSRHDENSHRRRPAAGSCRPRRARADPAFCTNYSTAAVRQAHVAHVTPPCAPGAIGARWTENYRVHYGWCITAPYAAVNAERAMRTAYLRSCRG
jgi:hypothetical protein